MLNNKNIDYATKYKILKGCTLYNYRLENPFKQLEGPRGITPSSTLTDMKYYVCTTGNVVDAVVTPSEPAPESGPVSFIYTVTSIAGNINGFLDGIGDDARFFNPQGVAVFPNGNIVVADTVNHRIRLITPDSNVTTIAGGSSSGAFADGTGTNARFNQPLAVAVLSNGNILVADTFNHRIRLITPDSNVTTLAGGSSSGAFADGIGTNARFNRPRGVAMLSNGNIVVADSLNRRIRLITPDSNVTTLAGSNNGFADGTGTSARFSSPSGIAVLPNGNIVVSDNTNHRIRLITPDSNVTTIAGSNQGFSNGTGTNARFNGPIGVAVLPNGNIVVADTINYRIRLITITQE